MPESRLGAFSAGQDPGLSADSMRFNSQVPHGFIQTSVIQQQLPSANGMAATDYKRVLPGSQGGRPVILPSANGTSTNTYDQNTIMRLQGRNVV